MKITVAMAVFNGAAYLAEQLESIAAQSRLPDELVVADDASTDDTLDIVAAFALHSPFEVRVIRKSQRMGCNHNFETAIRHSQGDVVALSDQDDVWLPRHIELITAPFARSDNIGLVISDSTCVDQKLHPLGTTFWAAERFTLGDARRIKAGNQFAEWTKHHVVAGHALAFRRHLADVFLPFHHAMMYDHWLSFVCAACAIVEMIPDQLTLHRRHQKQLAGLRPVSLVERSASQPTIAGTHFQGQIDQWESLRSRLASNKHLLMTGNEFAVCEERLALLRSRASMREFGLSSRVAAAIRLLATGRYHRSGRGFLTFMRDVRG